MVVFSNQKLFITLKKNNIEIDTKINNLIKKYISDQKSKKTFYFGEAHRVHTKSVLSGEAISKMYIKDSNPFFVKMLDLTH